MPRDDEPGVLPGYLRRVQPDARVRIAAHDVLAVHEGELARAAREPAHGRADHAARFAERFLIVDLSRKGVPAAVDRANDPCVVLLSDRPADPADDLRQAGIGDEHSRPDALDQLGLR